MRLTDVDALIKTVDELPHSYNGWSDAYDKAFIIQTIEDAPTIEPNLVINPDEVNRGDVTMIGMEIVVMHYDDYMEMMLKSAAVDDGSWERFAAEPCEDAIGREDAIEALKRTPREELEWDSGEETLRDLPSVAPSRPSGEWIPCSERLPEENGESYLTYQGSAEYGFCQVLYYDDGWNCYHGDKENEINGVVAWMPLPEPYKESE